ncbi:hypothetical protein SO802_006666 [Lithocarpus litseifolius]|uniref:Uncharacterized protein n=1 Tax=Lithocarpus litseifolius TaxID=425828 RepID=A0AAW2DPU2_9ROSI
MQFGEPQGAPNDEGVFHSEVFTDRILGRLHEAWPRCRVTRGIAPPRYIYPTARYKKWLEDDMKWILRDEKAYTKTSKKESKVKKPPHVEIHDDEEEKEEWDEKDKVEYEMNKQFEKLTAETMAMREKMEKMQLAFHKVQGMDDYLYNMGGMSSKAPIALPSKFKISDAKKFDGTGDLKQHVRRNLSLAEIKSMSM